MGLCPPRDMRGDSCVSPHIAVQDRAPSAYGPKASFKDPGAFQLMGVLCSRGAASFLSSQWADRESVDKSDPHIRASAQGIGHYHRSRPLADTHSLPPGVQAVWGSVILSM